MGRIGKPDQQCGISYESIIGKLKLMIPKYMLPGKVVSLQEMPLNSNGKIDRAKLREMIIGI